jgi:hypothetical protein
MGFNPKTQQKIRIPAKTVLKFRVAKVAKDTVLGVKKELGVPEQNHPGEGAAQRDLAWSGRALRSACSCLNLVLACIVGDIPFPRRRERFVEIVNGKDYPSLRRGKPPQSSSGERHHMTGSGSQWPACEPGR